MVAHRPFTWMEPFPRSSSGISPCCTLPVLPVLAGAPGTLRLVPGSPVFTYPNAIGPAAWNNWVQERGLYFLGDKDPKYVDLVSMTDSFQDNPGEKLGSLVEAKFGKGRWFYLGLGLWRQLPAGTDGAYQILANLISPVRPAAPAKPAAAK